MENKIQENAYAHNKIFKVYNLKHSEIYNDFEQSRIRLIISKLLSNKKRLKVLDVGAGTGNLTLKFLEAGCEVVASDVSKKSLNLLKTLSSHNPRLKLALITEKILPFKDNQFDIVCAYSVLHHIPDYLFAIREMIRVCKPNGFIYIDHEANENKWSPNKKLIEYYRLTKQTHLEHFFKLIKTKEFFKFDIFKTAFIKLFINKRYEREGDIHVWPDDNINWERIKEVVKQENCNVVTEENYLIYRPKINLSSYNNFKKLCNDSKYVFIKKFK